jgi:hypothetical protein
MFELLKAEEEFARQIPSEDVLEETEEPES